MIYSEKTKILIKNKVAFITGASSARGIGWTAAKRFANEGARVALIDSDSSTSDQAVSAIGAAHKGYVCDVRHAKQCQKIVAQIIADFGYEQWFAHSLISSIKRC